MMTKDIEKTKTKKDLLSIFEAWCLWNKRLISTDDFVSKYGANPRQVRNQYWENKDNLLGISLQEYWIKKHTSLKR